MTEMEFNSVEATHNLASPNVESITKQLDSLSNQSSKEKAHSQDIILEGANDRETLDRLSNNSRSAMIEVGEDVDVDIEADLDVGLDETEEIESENEEDEVQRMLTELNKEAM